MFYARSNIRLSTLILTALCGVVLLTFVIRNNYQIRNTLSYATRPLWDTDEAPKDVLPHYHAEGFDLASDAQQICQLHEWPVRNADGGLKVLDAVLMSSELDLLEIRMNELDDVVDYFLIVESNTTFTGLTKETHFAQNRLQFGKFEGKIKYRL